MTNKSENPREKLYRKMLHSHWVKIVSALASVVVFCTAYALILPAITMSNQDPKCGIEEHTHIAECYDAEGNIICGLEEHAHSLSCYSDLYAAIEDEGYWSADIPELTGDRNADVLAVAQSQIGYRENDENYLISENEQTKGYTRYGHWYGEFVDTESERLENGLSYYAYKDWDAMFASFVLYNANIYDMGLDSDAGNWAGALGEAGIYVDAADYVPQIGDLIFYTRNAGENMHVGIVSGVNRGFFGNEIKSISVIAGDSNNEVEEIKVAVAEYTEGDITFETIHGYGVLTPGYGETDESTASEVQPDDSTVAEVAAEEIAGEDVAVEPAVEEVADASEAEEVVNLDNSADHLIGQNEESLDTVEENTEGSALVEIVDGAVSEDGSEIVMNWSLSANLPDATLPAGAIIRVDTASAKVHSMTVDQARAWAETAGTGAEYATFVDNDNYEVTFIGNNGLLYSWADVQNMDAAAATSFTGVHIKALNDVELGEDGAVFFDFTTTARVADANVGQNYYVSKVNVNGFAGAATFTYENGEAEAVDQNEVLRDAGLEEEPAQKTLVSKKSDYTVTMSYGPEAEIPDGSKLYVKEIKQGTEEYNQYIEDAKAALGISEEDAAELFGRFFDIKIMTKDGEFEPKAPVNVNIEYKKAIETEDASYVNAVHFSEDGTEAIPVATVDISEPEDEMAKVTNVEFSAESFSVYGVVYTVDFEVDGRTYSIPGSSSIALSDLLNAVGINIPIENVINVEFSDDSLISVKRIAIDTVVEIGEDNASDNSEDVFEYVVYAGDWLLTSLAPFNTDETLTITTLNGMKYVINVTDAQFTSNLADVLTDVYIKINGNKINDGESITVEEGQTFDMHMEFQENDFLQLPEDATAMTYQLPNGISLGDHPFSRKVNVNLGIDGIVKNNTLTYDPATNSLSFTWNRRDPKFSRLLAADNTKLIFDLTGQFTSDATHVDFGLDYDITVTQTEKKDASVTKDGQVYLPGENGNPFGNQPAIKYTVTVTSEGATTVNVNDTVEGSAVTLETTQGGNGGWSAVSNKGTQINPSFRNDGKGFSLNNLSLQDGEVVTITYWGRVNTSGIENLTNVTYQQTGNKVTLTGDDIPDKEVTHFEHSVGYNKVTKTAERIDPVDAEGKQIVHWKTTVNDPPTESIGGSTITDRIASASVSYMDFAGPGIHVVAKNAAGQVVQDMHNIPWDDPRISVTNQEWDKHWVFTIPDTNEALVYEIEYETVVNTNKYYQSTGQNGGYFSVVNEAEGKPGKGTGTATVGIPEGEVEPPPVNYTKTAVEVDEDYITWNVSINIKRKPEGYNSFVIEDKLPSTSFYDVGYVDTVESISVDGLEGDEWYSTSYKYENQGQNFIDTGDNTKPSHVVLTFYKEGKANESTANPGINAQRDRILNLTIVTKNSDRWLQIGAEHYTEQQATDHTNALKINEWNTVTDTAKPMKKTVMKLRDGKHEVSGPGQAAAFAKVGTPGTTENPHGVIIDNTQTQYPAYKFWVLVGGVTSSNLENGNQIIFSDTFNEHFRLMLPEGVEQDKQPKVFGTYVTGSTGSQLQLDPSKGQEFSWTQSDGNAVFTLTNPPKDGDTYYPYYLVEYWLVPKSQEDLEAIRLEAMNNDGLATLENIVTSDDISDELDFTYSYKVIDKSSRSDTNGSVSLEQYTIDINPDMLTLNNGEVMTLTDTYSRNLSVDFGTIEVQAKQKTDGGEETEQYYDEESQTYKPIKDLITWDFRNHVGTYTIPDKTHVTITYYARVVGEPGSLQTITNTAYMEGYYDTVTEDRMVDVSGEGSADIIRIRLLKFGADHMEGGLNGAVFRLLDQDKNVLKTFTTDETGYLNKYGVLHAENDVIDYTENGDNFIAEVQPYQLTPEAQQRVTEGTLKLTITENDFLENETWAEYCARNPGGLVTYKDISEDALSTLGINRHAGFAEIMLDMHIDGITLKRERPYYLQEIVAPPGYEIDTTLYSFLITEQANYTAPQGVYIYHNNDVLTVRDWPEETPSLKLQKTFSGNVELTDEQKNNVTFTIKKHVDNEWVDYPISVWREDSKVDVSSFTYGDYGVKENTSTTPATYTKGDLLFKDGVMKIDNLPAGEYRVIESNMNMQKEGGGYYDRRTEYLVDGSTVRVNGDIITHDEGTGQDIITEDSEENGVIVTVDGEKSNLVSITNTYFTKEFTLTKTAADTAELLGDAKFAIYSKNASGESIVKQEVLTDNNGKIEIKKTGNSWDSSITFAEDTLYYIVETEAPSGFITPEEPDKYYFYFDSDESNFDPAPLLPQGESAVNLGTGFGTARVSNKRDTEKTYFKINKKWINSLGQDITGTMTDAEGISVTLKRTTTKPNVGKAITTVAVEDVETSLSNLHTLTLINTATNQAANTYFLPGDKLQISVFGVDLSELDPNQCVTTIPYTALTNVVKNKEMVSWTLEGPNADVTATINDNTVTKLAVSNANETNRTYVLTEAEAEDINGENVPDCATTLDTTNNWAETFSNLPKHDGNGNLYFYYVVEAPTTAQETTISISGKNITVANTTPEQLEVNKKWEDVDGNSVNDEKTDGSIVYELYQVENPLEMVDDYSHSGDISINTDGMLKSNYYPGTEPITLTGDAADGKILSGSNIKIEITTTASDNNDLTGEINVIGGTARGTGKGSDAVIFENPGGDTPEIKKKRVIYVDNVTSTVTLSGVFQCSGGPASVIATVVSEPRNEDGQFELKQRYKMGEVTVTYDGATFVKDNAYPSSSVRVTKGAKAWSSLINNLPSIGFPDSGQNAGKTVKYSYYVVEVPSPVSSNYENATYQVDASPVEIADGDPGDTIVIINKEKEVPKGSLSITKVVSTAADLIVAPDTTFTFEVQLTTLEDTAYVGNVIVTDKDRTEAEVQTDSSGKITVSVTGAGTATIAGIPEGTKYVVTEPQRTPADGWVQDGEIVYGDNSKTIAANDTDTATVKNKRLKDFEFRKEWHTLGDPTNPSYEWPDDTSITVTVHRKVEDKVDSNYSLTYTIAKTDLVLNKQISGSNVDDPKLVVTNVTEFMFKLSDLAYSGTVDSTSGEYTYYVTEIQVPGYKVPEYKDSSDHITNTYATNGGAIVNKPEETYNLPETGGVGTSMYRIAGWITIVMALIGIYLNKRRERWYNG